MKKKYGWDYDSELKNWVETAKLSNKLGLLIMLDQQDNEIFPIYLDKYSDYIDVVNKFISESKCIMMDCFDLSIPIQWKEP